MDEKNEPSTWHVAAVAMCLFLGLMLIATMFGGAETIAIASQ